MWECVLFVATIGGKPTLELVDWKLQFEIRHSSVMSTSEINCAPIVDERSSILFVPDSYDRVPVIQANEKIDRMLRRVDAWDYYLLNHRCRRYRESGNDPQEMGSESCDYWDWVIGNPEAADDENSIFRIFRIETNDEPNWFSQPSKQVYRTLKRAYCYRVWDTRKRKEAFRRAHFQSEQYEMMAFVDLNLGWDDGFLEPARHSPMVYAPMPTVDDSAISHRHASFLEQISPPARPEGWCPYGIWQGAQELDQAFVSQRDAKYFPSLAYRLSLDFMPLPSHPDPYLCDRQAAYLEQFMPVPLEPVSPFMLPLGLQQPEGREY